MRKNVHREKRSSAEHPHLAPPQLEAVSKLFAALSEPSRLQILQVLRGGEMHVTDLVTATGLKQANVSKQLGILTLAGIISRRQDGNRVFYAIAMPMVFELCEVVCNGVAKAAENRAAMLRSN